MKSGRIKEIFENWSEIKIISKKTKVLGIYSKIESSKIIWKLAFWELNLKEIGILKIIWELEFRKLFEDGI